MVYEPLGSRRLTGKADTSGQNTGNWTVAFTPADFNVNVPVFEVYKIIIAGAAGSSFTVFIDNNQWDVTQQGNSNSWEPQGGLLLLNPGNTLYFFWSDPSNDGSPPQVTVWLRYEKGP